MFKKAFSIALAIMMVIAVFPFSAIEANAASLVITLDPGHGKNASADGSTGSGANGATQWGGVNEYIYNWDITKAAEARLKEYQNCTVYLTKSTADETPGLVPRVQTAVNNGSDGIISIHNNSAGAAAYGASVFTPNLNWRKEMGQNSKNCAKIILNKLYGVGLGDYLSTWEGGIPEDNSTSLYYDGNGGTTSTKTSYGIADRLQIIKHAKLKGLNIGMIVECAFVSNQSDVQNFLMNPVKINAMGVAIADGIAEYYGLTMGSNCINTIDSAGLQNGSLANAVIAYDHTAFIGDSIDVRGWSVHSDGVANYKYTVNGTDWVNVAGGFRQDVANATKDYTNCADKNCFDFKIPTAGLAAGNYNVKIAGVTKLGETYDIAAMRLTLKPEPQKIEGDVAIDRDTESGKTFIKDIALDTTADELLAKFSKDGCVIKNNNGVTVTAGKLGTGYVVELVIDGYVHETATVIVKGDLDGDARANSKDIILAKLYIASQQGGNVSKLASDMDNNGTVSATDIDAIANAIVK